MNTTLLNIFLSTRVAVVSFDFVSKNEAALLEAGCKVAPVAGFNAVFLTGPATTLDTLGATDSSGYVATIQKLVTQTLPESK